MNRTPGGGHPSAELAGLDASGTVGLRLGRTNTDVRVQLALARLAARSREPVPPAPAPAPPATREAAAQLGRAWQDLREFRLQVSELGAVTSTVHGPGRRVTAVLRGGQILGLDLAPTWRQTASDAELENHIAHTLGAALRQAAVLPERALDGCPDLAAVLAHSGGWPGGWSEGLR